MNSLLSGDGNILAAHADGATLHRTCTIYGGETIHGTKSVGLSSPAQQGRECDPWSEQR